MVVSEIYVQSYDVLVLTFWGENQISINHCETLQKEGNHSCGAASRTNQGYSK